MCSPGAVASAAAVSGGKRKASGTSCRGVRAENQKSATSADAPPRVELSTRIFGVGFFIFYDQ